MDTSYTGQVSRVVELLQGKWTVQILCAMRTRPVRLSESNGRYHRRPKKRLRRAYVHLKLRESFYDET